MRCLITPPPRSASIRPVSASAIACHSVGSSMLCLRAKRAKVGLEYPHRVYPTAQDTTPGVVFLRGCLVCIDGRGNDRLGDVIGQQRLPVSLHIAFEQSTREAVD